MAASFLKRKPKEPERPQRVEIPAVEADPELGLTGEQVHERLAGGWDNRPVEPPGATVQQIIVKNVCTYFNFLFFLLAGCVIAVRQWLNLTFLGPVFCNMFIGIVQDLRVKKKVDNLRIMSAPKCRAVRDGQIVQTEAAALVRDDIAVFGPGDQIPADAVVAAGECHVNEALVTGEADEIVKRPGDALLSGSFVVSGSCRARLTKVGADSFVSRLTIEARQTGSQPQSEMMRSLTSLIKWIGFLVIPLGAVMFIKEYLWLKSPVADAVTSTVGSIVGMIPEGLYLLTSLALVASVIRLANRRTLVHDMGCIETLARVDTLCVDKTGTITEPKMTVDDIVPLQPDRYIADDIRMIMADYVCAMQDDNDTMAALRRYFTGQSMQTAIAAMPFRSAKKYGGVSFYEDETYLLGAPEILLAACPEKDRFLPQAEEWSAKGCRVLLLALYDGKLDDEALTAEMMPLALILLSNKIRPEAPQTFAYFAQQGVRTKVISGDNPLTVSEVARRAGIPDAEKFVDARTLKTDAELAKAAEEMTVFGRVTPDQKKKLVAAGGAYRRHDGRRRQRRAGPARSGLFHRHGLRLGRGVSGVAYRAARFAVLRSALRRGGGAAGHQQHRAQRLFVSGQEHLHLRALAHYPVLYAPLSLYPGAAESGQRADDRHPVVRSGHGAEREPHQRKIHAQRDLPRAARGADGPRAGGGRHAVLSGLPHPGGNALDDLHGHHGRRGPADGLSDLAAVQQAAQGDDDRPDGGVCPVLFLPAEPVYAQCAG